MKELYHYTSMNHIQKIMDSGYLKLTPSNLIKPTDLKMKIIDGRLTYFSELSDPIKPVVWLTDSTDTDGLGLETPMDKQRDTKKRIRITIPMKATYHRWVDWAFKNHMNMKWFRKFTQGMNYSSWYVSESCIPLEDIATIEDMETGEYIYRNPQFTE